MITGPYAADRGARVYGRVLFPTLGETVLGVWFTVDSGAYSTCLFISDFSRLGGQASRLPLRASPNYLAGIGGRTRTLLTDAIIEFEHARGQRSSFALEIHLILDRSYAGLPSLLGRDILFLGDTRLEPSRHRVRLDIPVGHHVIPDPAVN